jgi:outer membrane receptor protein involved in Fe transport
MRSFRIGRVGLAVLLALGATAQARAEDTDKAAAAPAANADGTLEAIVVTSNRRVSTVQDTAASITAVSAADIANRGLTDFNALAQSVPGIALRSAGPGQTEFEMRGLSSAGGNSSMVGFYLDETPLSSPAAAQVGKVVIDPNLYDLERVEVLRGPQGTLYGSSSMGGTVKLLPTAPQLGEFEASGESKFSHTSGGGLNESVNAMLNIPLDSTAALRLVASTINDSGWIKRNVIADGAIVPDAGAFPNVTRPANFYTAPLAASYPGANTTQLDSFRASVLWKPINQLTVTPLLMWQNTIQGGSNTVDVNGVPQYPTVPAINAHWEAYDTPEPQTDRLTLGSLKVEYQFPGFSVTSATGDWSRSLVISQDGSEENASAIGAPVYDAPAGIGPAGPTPYGPGVTEKDYTAQLSEELRFTSTAEGPFQWIGGYFFQKLETDWSEYSLNPQFTGNENIYVDFQPQKIFQNSLFGEASYQFTPQLKGTVGLRHYAYSLEQHNTEYGLFTVYAAQGNSVPYNTWANQAASGTDPKVDLSFALTKDALLYATVAKGFRLGGVNQPIPVAACTPANIAANSVLTGNEKGLQNKLLLNSACDPSVLLQAPATFASDSVWNYEVGEKASFLDRQLTLNTSVYYERWRNPQIATNLAGFGISVNGADARIVGLESEVHARLPLGFEVSGNVGYTDATFDSSSAITGFPSGLHVPDTPELTGSLVLSSHQKVGDLRLVGSFECDYVGTRTDAPYGETIALYNVNSLLIHLPAYEIFTLRYGVHTDNWRITAFANNLFNKEALLDPQPQINLQTAAFTRYTVNQPRTIGLDFSYTFGR